MRIDNPSTGTSALARFRAQLNRARRTLSAQGPAVRWTLGVAAAACLVLGVYWTAPSSSTGVYLGNGQQFNSDDILKITRELNARQIVNAVVDRKIEVGSDHRAEAEEALTKLDVGPRPIGDIRNAAPQGNFLTDGPGERERRETQRRNEVLEAFIRRLPGVVNAYVSVHREQVRGGLRPVFAVTAFVWVETEKNRALGFTTLQSVQDILAGNEAGLKPESVTVMDASGRSYLDANDRSVGARTMTRGREEALSGKILQELDHIKDLRVTVQLPAPIAPAPAVAPRPVSPPPPPPAEEFSPRVAANQPLELEPEPLPKPTVPEPAPPPVAPAPEPARVWVKVPSSFYLRMRPDHEPSSDELKQVRERTENQIRTAVELAIPASEFGAPKVTIDTIPDHRASAPPPLPTAAAEVRTLSTWWIAVIAGGAVVAVLVFVGVVAASRRPSARLRSTAPAADFSRYKVDVDEAREPGPGPTERVRELIRLSPEAAASVLQRWTGPGGRDA